MIDKTEDRYKFPKILDTIEADKFADKVGYPVLVHPSYVLSVVITKFISGASEIDVDAINKFRQ
ncbi:20607_t:CDS:2, partial [Entrophospora sp. SA101]